MAQSRRSEHFGVARAACFERLAGVFASRVALRHDGFSWMEDITTGGSVDPIGHTLQHRQRRCTERAIRGPTLHRTECKAGKRRASVHGKDNPGTDAGINLGPGRDRGHQQQGPPSSGTITEAAWRVRGEGHTGTIVQLVLRSGHVRTAGTGFPIGSGMTSGGNGR